MKKINLQLFADNENESTAAETAFDGIPQPSSTGAEAGKNWLLGIFSADGATLLAVAGQQGLTINRSAESIDTGSKDIEGGWKSKQPGMKEWSIETDGLYIRGSEAHAYLSQAFEEDTAVCVKVYDRKTQEGLYAGFAIITDYPLEAPYDDAVNYNLTFDGCGKLYDYTLDEDKLTGDILPSAGGNS